MDNTNNVTLLAAEPYISELTETQSKLTTSQGEGEAQLSKKVIVLFVRNLGTNVFYWQNFVMF